MSETDFSKLLRERGIQPSAQRVAIAGCVLRTEGHPTAEEVHRQVRKDFPFVSRATVYNTLNLFVDKGLLGRFHIDEVGAVFDANVDRHHHFVDDGTGVVHDIPWDELTVSGLDSLPDVEITEYMVVMRGRKKSAGARGRKSGGQENEGGKRARKREMEKHGGKATAGETERRMSHEEVSWMDASFRGAPLRAGRRRGPGAGGSGA